MIKKARLEKKLTQGDIAKHLKVKQPYISKIENRKAGYISINKILKLSEVLDLDPVEVFKFLIEYDS